MGEGPRLDSKPTLGERARRTRLARGLSLRAAAQQVGVPFNTLCRVENGKDCLHSAAEKVEEWIHGDLSDRTRGEAYAAGFADGLQAAVSAIGGRCGSDEHGAR